MSLPCMIISEIDKDLLLLLTDLTSVLAELTSQEKKDECVAHALKLRTAWSLQNYKRFFQFYLQAPKMSGYLID